MRLRFHCQHLILVARQSGLTLKRIRIGNNNIRESLLILHPGEGNLPDFEFIKYLLNEHGLCHMTFQEPCITLFHAVL